MKEKSTIRHFLIISIGTFINLIISILTTPIITRLVNPTEYGQLSIFNLYASICVMIFCVGLDQALVRFYYEYDSIDYHKKLLNKCWIAPVVCWCLFAVTFIILYSLGLFEFEFDLNITIVLAVCVLFELISRFSILLMRLEYHSAKYSMVNIATKVSYAATAILFVRLNDGHYLLILTLCTTFSHLVSMVISMFFERKVWFRKQLSDENIFIDTRQLIRYGGPFILSLGITTVFHGIDKMSLNYFSTYTEVGIYSSAMSLVNVFAIIQTSFNAVWAPMATEHYEKNREDKTFYQKGNAYITILMFGAGLCLILAKDVFAFLLGEKYRDAAYILPCLIFSPIMYTISETTVSGINFSKKSHLHIFIAAGACIVNIIGNTILVPVYGGKGAAISTGFSYIVFFSLRTLFSHKYFKVNFRLPRLYILTVVVFIYALYNTFIPFGLLTIIGFIMCIVLMYFLYIKEVHEGCILATKKLVAFFKMVKTKSLFIISTEKKS